MNDAEDLEHLLIEWGTDHPAVDAVVRVEPHEWALLFADDATLGVRWCDEARDASFELPVGRPAPEARLAAYEAALRLNAAWRDTGGLRVSMVEEDGELLLSFSAPCAALDGRALADLVEALRTWAADCRAAFAGPAAAPGDAQPAPWSLA